MGFTATFFFPPGNSVTLTTSLRMLAASWLASWGRFFFFTMPDYRRIQAGRASLRGFKVAHYPEMRGSGLGAAVVARVARNAPLTVLETERAEEGPTAGRRLAWYRRLGFSENPQAYRQPSYGPGLPDVPMHLLSHPRPLEAREFESVVRILRRDVYAVRGG
ncbi:MAG: hypothetical protein J0L84_01850 [Verrucomicrobia bacterium]|nr:hypothetical protein [Verrucomicrobiota bacterium]